MIFWDADDAPVAKSSCSTRTTDNPDTLARYARAAPVMPPPTTASSNCDAVNASIGVTRSEMHV
ncbi:MAG: hypothetical protein M5U09_04250 [Gammaproteobacteria bacterium]|nr:hypothetical protein [Gammaproteobacteria bacterium]